jgi:subtilisin-like proprotein convertase family protein
MKKILFISTTAILLSTFSSRATITFTETGTGGTIRDNNPNGFSSQITIAQNVTISDITVHLNFTGGYNGDLYAYLTHDGSTAILLNRINNDASGMDVYFNDSGSYDDIHMATGIPSGTYSSDGRFADPSDLAAIASASRTRTLSSFFGANSSGTWTLFVADMDPGAQSTLTSWDMEITGVPEPTNVALLAFGGIFVFVQSMRLLKKKSQNQQSV